MKKLSEKALALMLVKTNGLNLRHLPESFRRDIDVVKAAVKSNKWAILHAMGPARNDWRVYKEAYDGIRKEQIAA